MARLVCVAVVWIVAMGAALAQDGGPTEREFRMGFTPFPHDISLEALGWVDRFVGSEADIVACHFEGVPWAEAHSGEPFHPRLMEEWRRALDAAPDGAAVYLAVTPIALSRDRVAPYRAEEEDLPIPEPIAGLPFDDPLLMQTYLAYVRRAVEFFDPDYLAIAIESNELRHNAPDQWDAYTRLHTHVYEAIKAERPDLPIFASLTLHSMRNPEWTDSDAVLADWLELTPCNDLVAISAYPFLGGRTARIAEDLAWLDRTFGPYGKPFAVAEMGENAEPLRLEGFGVTLPGTPDTQKAVLEAFLEFLGAHESEFVIWFVPRDYDLLWEKIATSAPEWAKAWKDCGLVSEDGLERPALALWREWMAR